MDKQLTIKTYFESDLVRDKFREVLGQKSPAFIASMLSVVNGSEQLAQAEPKSVYCAAMIAATLDLPINPSLGVAFIIPYWNSKDQKYYATFQAGYRAYIQLAQRTGLYKIINSTDVREGEYKGIDRLTGEIEWNWLKDEDEREKLPVIGYVAHFSLLSGFSKSKFMTLKQLNAHGVKYSQTFKKGYGLWKDNFDAMALKTPLKLLLSKYAPLSTEMQKLQLADQAIIKEDGEVEYVDNQKLLPSETNAEKERNRVTKFITDAESIAVLKQCEEHIVDEETRKLFDDKYTELENKEASK